MAQHCTDISVNSLALLSKRFQKAYCDRVHMPLAVLLFSFCDFFSEPFFVRQMWGSKQLDDFCRAK